MLVEKYVNIIHLYCNKLYLTVASEMNVLGKKLYFTMTFELITMKANWLRVGVFLHKH